MELIYFIIALLATTLGTMTGLGAGVIIKPLLDTFAHFDLSTTGLLSSFAVFFMAIVSTIKQWKVGFKFEKRLYVISAGAIMGGIIGNLLFGKFLLIVPEDIGKAIQALILALLLIMVIFRSKLPHFHIKNLIATFIIGIILGTIASFLGIGGGPFNVAVLIMFFAMDIKKAAINSVFIILLSQFSKLLTILITTGFSSYNLKMLWFMIPASIIGGHMGTKLNHHISSEKIHKIFILLVILMVALNVYNAIEFLFL
ncbi:sulfite exporter TauE/SafE family protein [Clostridium grantii]|uniref:Probable membrane transporter protein n=1 Tax=Clostridium grantii DSM 8605 TaxID=1121316 RepID=A0A1M5QZ55_9CLOT|nr:sulfite exporter TauE/SafE family protein [Clostridium grantii]SHH18813.1 hypothetical protein SAMN02745207_00357 [Clostridium grantii DSM 8605]